MNPDLSTIPRFEITRRSGPDDQGKFGHGQLVGRTFACDTGELPDRNNQKDISCTAKGTYLAEWLYSPEHKQFLYHIIKFLEPDGTWGPIPGGRSEEEVHSGNVCGDKALGYQSDVLGCIILGAEIVTFKKGTQLTKSHPVMEKDQLGVSASGPTLTQFHKALQNPDGTMPRYIVIAISQEVA